jgi:signal transduction histidine kinase
VPTYFSNANDAIVQTLQLPPNFTGQKFKINIGLTIELIQQVLPRTKRIVLVGNSPQQDVYRPFFSQELAPYAKQFAITDLRGKPIDEMLRAIAHLDQDTVIYRTGLSRDASGKIYDSFALMAMITKAANRPVFVDYMPFIGLGTLGGVAIDPEPQGRNAAAMVKLILQGQRPNAIPVSQLQFQPSFDWRELKRWGISESSLPSNSKVLFYMPTVWEQYRIQIALTAAVIATLSMLVMALLIERRRRAQAVAESRARLAELAHLNRNATAMVYSGAIAHELNQPLAAILSNAQAAKMMLATAPPALEEISQILNDIEVADRRASELIRSMRGLLKKGEVKHEAIDMNDIVKSAVAFISPEARVRQASLRVRLTDSAVYVLGDQIQLQQVLINLIINSMDAMSERSAPSRVVEIATAIQTEESISVTVTDAGPGFSCDLSTIFQSFTTTKVHGTGLGLAITAALIREHCGTITAENLENRGARVTIVLPRTLPQQHTGKSAMIVQ